MVSKSIFPIISIHSASHRTILTIVNYIVKSLNDPDINLCYSDLME